MILTEGTKLKVNFFSCGDVTAHVCSWGSDSYWIEKITGSDDCFQYILTISISDDDDFGGTMIYVVPEFEVLKYANKLNEWIIEVSQLKEIKYEQFFEEDFYPSFENIPRYLNW